MIIDNVKVYTEEKTFVKGGIMLDGDKIQRVYAEEEKPQFGEKEVLDGEGAYAIPGLIDLHFHGCKGDDFCDGNEEAIERIAQYEASIGVTAIAPATMTLPVEELKQILSVAAKYKKNGTSPKAADLVGINMEGPFISKVKKGAQDERNIIPCNVEIAEQFLEASDGLVKFIGIAPEDNEDYLEFIEEMKGKVNISLAHTNADYDTAKKAFDELGVKKLPTVKSLQVEFAELLTTKKEAYAALKKVRDELRDVAVHTANYEELRDLAQRDPRKEKEHGRE